MCVLSRRGGRLAKAVIIITGSGVGVRVGD